MDYEKLLKKVKENPVPKHVGVIMDGNRRWAQNNKLETLKGHRTGYDSLKDVLRGIRDAGIKTITAFAFSTENFNRNKKEKNHLFNLFAKGFDELKEDPEVHEHKLGINIFGDEDKLPKKVLKSFQAAKEATKGYDNYFLNLCMAYGGQDEIVKAVKKIIRKGYEEEDVTPKLIKQHLYSRDFPPPDLIIRTGMKNAQRLSGFMLWDSAYSEFVFHKTFWPDYDKKKLLQDVLEFQKRKRRFGR